MPIVRPQDLSDEEESMSDEECEDYIDIHRCENITYLKDDQEQPEENSQVADEMKPYFPYLLSDEDESLSDEDESRSDDDGYICGCWRHLDGGNYLDDYIDSKYGDCRLCMWKVFENRQTNDS